MMDISDISASTENKPESKKNPDSAPGLRRIDDKNNLWISLKSLNPHLICGLCQGYLYEASTITECMHSCRFFYKMY